MRQKHFPGSRPAIAAICAAAVAFTLGGAAYAQTASEWSFSELAEDNGGGTVARLLATAARGDRVKLSGICRSTPKSETATSDLTLALEVGSQMAGAPLKVRFSGGGQETTFDGEVAGPDAAEGIIGAVLRPEHDAELWQMLTTLDSVDVAVPGYVGTTLDLGSGREEIELFRVACRTYAQSTEETAQSEKEPEIVSADAPAKPVEDLIADAKTERGAFAEAKDSQTIDGWNAYLKRFPSGFRADLARAYIRRLEEEQVVVEAGSASWNVDQESIASDDGRIIDVATVKANGAELVASCQTGARPSLSLAIRPEAGNSTVADALEAAVRDAKFLSTSKPGVKQIDVTFSDGARLRRASTYDTLGDGQGLRILSNGELLDATGAGVGRLLSERSVKVEAASFTGEFQLDGSKAAICTVLSACGVNRPDCDGVAPPAGEPITTSSLVPKDDVEEAGSAPVKPAARSAPKLKQTRDTPSCSGGRYYNRRSGSCACPSSRPHWNGRRCYGKVARKSPARVKRQHAQRKQGRNCRIDFNRNTMYDKKGHQQLTTVCD